MSEPEQLTLNPYHKRDAMPTEIESAEAILKSRDPNKPLKVGKCGHRVLRVYARVDGRAMTAYEASFRATGGDWHGLRRESERLAARGYLQLCDFTLPNGAPRGRPSVEAWTITQAGLDWLAANPWPDA